MSSETSEKEKPCKLQSRIQSVALIIFQVLFDRSVQAQPAGHAGPGGSSSRRLQSPSAAPAPAGARGAARGRIAGTRASGGDADAALGPSPGAGRRAGSRRPGAGSRRAAGAGRACARARGAMERSADRPGEPGRLGRRGQLRGGRAEGLANDLPEQEINPLENPGREVGAAGVAEWPSQTRPRPGSLFPTPGNKTCLADLARNTRRPSSVTKRPQPQWISEGVSRSCAPHPRARLVPKRAPRAPPLAKGSATWVPLALRQGIPGGLSRAAPGAVDPGLGGAPEGSRELQGGWSSFHLSSTGT